MESTGTGDAEDTLQGRLRAAEAKIAAHPAYRALGVCDELQRSIEWVFLPNLAELVGLLERAATDEELAIELMQNMWKPVIRERFQAAVTRGLHNYLSSAMSLVDHVRALMRGRTGAIANEFARRRSALVTNPEVPFVQDLRNFTVHLALPLVGHTVTLPGSNDPGGVAAGEVEVAVTQLLSWKGWTAASMSYLEQQGDAIALRPVIRRHGELFLELNVWLHRELSRENEPGLAALDGLILERNAILYGVDLAQADALTREDMLRRSQLRPQNQDAGGDG